MRILKKMDGFCAKWSQLKKQTTIKLSMAFQKGINPLYLKPIIYLCVPKMA
jgi:hypothetical protein